MIAPYKIGASSAFRLEMAPEIKDNESVQYEETTESDEKFEELIAPQAAPRKYEIVYRNVLVILYWHIAGLYGLYLCFTSAKSQTIILVFILFTISVIGITAGAHRLWTHRAYKAKLPLQILLMMMNNIGNIDVIDWVRDHRLHHKHTDTDADPHNAARGFFYSHIGWLLVKKHIEVKRRGKSIDKSDIENNPVLQFQKKYYSPLIYTLCYGLQTVLPMYCWGETFNNAWHITILRLALCRNAVFLINSAAHMFGSKPYDKSILPTQNISLSVLLFGEGFHNYHHVFPWDYRAAELGNNVLNWTTLFIDFFAWIGWAYDLKTVSKEAIERRAEKTGDGTNLWGWGDKDMVKEDRDAAEVRFQKEQ